MRKNKPPIDPAKAALARQIAADLFRAGCGIKAHRVVLEVTNQNGSKSDCGGWCEDAAADRIYRHLIGDLPE